MVVWWLCCELLVCLIVASVYVLFRIGLSLCCLWFAQSSNCFYMFYTCCSLCFVLYMCSYCFLDYMCFLIYFQVSGPTIYKIEVSVVMVVLVLCVDVELLTCRSANLEFGVEYLPFSEIIVSILALM